MEAEDLLLSDPAYHVKGQVRSRLTFNVKRDTHCDTCSGSVIIRRVRNLP